MPAFSVLCFTLVLMTWYGVNFVLGTGLHSYGFGGGGQGYVLAAVALQFLFVAGPHCSTSARLHCGLPLNRQPAAASAL